MKTNLDSNNVLETYGVGSRVIVLINQKSTNVPTDLNWLEVAYLYVYAKHIRGKLQSWITKIQKHFAQNDPESVIIIALARHNEELKRLLVNEIVHITRLLPLHDFRTALALLPKLKGENKKRAMEWIKGHAMKTKEDDNKISCLLAYHNICSKKEQAEIIEEIVKTAASLSDYHLCNLYEKIPDDRIAKLWLIAMGEHKYFKEWIDAAIDTGRNEFFEKAKQVKIIGAASDIFRTMRGKYSEYQDPRMVDLWLHTIRYFHAKQESNIIDYAIEAYVWSKNMDFFDFAKTNCYNFNQAKELYKLLPDQELLEKLKTKCTDFNEAKEGLVLTGDVYFLNQAKKYISEKWGYAIGYCIDLYKTLNEDPVKHQVHLQKVKEFIEDNMETLWKEYKNSDLKEGLLSLLVS